MFELRGRIRPPYACATAALAAIVAPLAGQSVALADDSREAVVDKAHWFEQRGQLEQAQELLSRATALAPADELLVVARAEAYLLDKNPFWALKVLGELIGKKPPACSARALAARVHIEEANLEQAAQMLDTPDCQHREESRLRFALLRLELAELRGERSQVSEQLRLGQATTHRYEEDDRRLTRLARRYDPWREPAFAFKLQLGAGWSSSGLGSVPLDLASLHPRGGSALLGMELETRLVPLQLAHWRPVLEVEAHWTQYLEPPTHALSTRQPLWRLGAEFGRGPRRLFLAYAGDVTNLDGGSDYPNESFVYASGHRLEYRILLGRTFLAQGAFGRRQFWQHERTRLESEHGLSKSISLSDTSNLTLSGNGHVFRSEHRAYDQFGAGAHAALSFALAKGFELRETLSLAYDLFPRSLGYFEPHRLERRKDSWIRVGVGLSAPDIMGLRLGVTYAYVNRASSATAYEFTDHRSVLTVTWQSDSDRLLVRSIPMAGRVPLSYPDDEAHAKTNRPVEIVEVIRKDESLRQNSSCMK